MGRARPPFCVCMLSWGKILLKFATLVNIPATFAARSPPLVGAISARTSSERGEPIEMELGHTNEWNSRAGPSSAQRSRFRTPDQEPTTIVIGDGFIVGEISFSILFGGQNEHPGHSALFNSPLPRVRYRAKRPSGRAIIFDGIMCERNASFT